MHGTFPNISYSRLLRRGALWSILVIIFAGWNWPATAQPGQPRGIYLLSNLGQGTPDPALLGKPFVDGYTLRILWSTVEPTRGAYDFSAIDAALASLALHPGKRLTLELFCRETPAYVLEDPGVVTYSAQRIGSQNGTTITLPVPWDVFMLERFEALHSALSAHLVPDPLVGRPMPLAQHSLLAHIDTSLPGLGGIRDQGNRLLGSPVYDRAQFLGVINRAVNIVEDRYPQAMPFMMFFNLQDGMQPALSDVIASQLRAEFFPGGGAVPRLALFKENFSCSQPSPVDALFKERNNTWIMLQALQPWVAPFTNTAATDACLVFDPPLAPGWQTGNNQADNLTRRTAVAGPEAGILYNLNTFNCRYYEVYAADLLQNPFADEWTRMHALLWAERTAVDEWRSWGAAAQ